MNTNVHAQRHGSVVDCFGRRFRWIAAIIAALALLVASPPHLAPFAQTLNHAVWTPVLYKGSAGWNSGVQIQNLGARDATVVATFYGPDGKIALTEPAQTIAAGSSRTFYLPATALPDKFAGSAAFRSDQPIAGIANLTNYDLGGGSAATSSYNAIDRPHSRINLPFISRSDLFNTSITVLNTATTSTTVEVTMYDANGDRVGGWSSLEMGPLNARTLDVARPSSEALGGQNFSGSAVLVTNNAALAVVVNVAFSTRLLSYRGESFVGNNLSLPLLMRARNGWNTLFTIRNDSDQAGDVHVQFYDDKGQQVAGADLEATIRPRGRMLLEQFTYDKLPAGFTGSAIVSSNVPFLSAIGVLNNDGLGQFTAYNADYVARATSRLSAPLVMKNNRGWNTGLQVQNLNPRPVEVTVQYYDTDNKLVATEKATAPPNAPHTFYTPSHPDLPDGFVGSAVVSAPNQLLVGLVNQVNYTIPGDTAMSYNAFPY